MKITGSVGYNTTMTGRRARKSRITTETIEKAHNTLSTGQYYPVVNSYLFGTCVFNGNIGIVVSDAMTGRIVTKLKLTPEEINDAFRKTMKKCDMK